MSWKCTQRWTLSLFYKFMSGNIFANVYKNLKKRVAWTLKVCREGEIHKPSTCTNIVLLKVHPYLYGESCSGKIVVGGNSFLILKKSYLECCCSVSSDFAAFVSFIKNQYYTITSTMHSFFPFTSSSSERAKYPSREGNEFIFGWFQYWINGVIL